jgi:hypothetical protein
MIQPSQLLRRALVADAIFSGASAVGLTLGAGGFAALFNLPEALLRETGLFLVAYTALVGWLCTAMPSSRLAAIRRARSMKCAAACGEQISRAVASNKSNQRSKWSASTGSGICLTIGVP